MALEPRTKTLFNMHILTWMSALDFLFTPLLPSATVGTLETRYPLATGLHFLSPHFTLRHSLHNLYVSFTRRLWVPRSLVEPIRAIIRRIKAHFVEARAI